MTRLVAQSRRHPPWALVLGPRTLFLAFDLSYSWSLLLLKLRSAESGAEEGEAELIGPPGRRGLKGPKGCVWTTPSSSPRARPGASCQLPRGQSSFRLARGRRVLPCALPVRVTYDVSFRFYPLLLFASTRDVVKRVLLFADMVFPQSLSVGLEGSVAADSASG